MIDIEKSSIQSDENNQEGATTLSSTSDSLRMKKIKGEFPRVRARIPCKLTLFAFTTFTDWRWVSTKMTDKLHSFTLQYSTTHCLNQTDFGTHLKNVVPNTLALHCISGDYIEICEGCESKKHKISVVRACAHTREGGKDEDREH
mgnify:CR=1 FL=1